MFNIGFWEIALIVVVALLVIRPDRLPQTARLVGVWLKRMNRLWSDLKKEATETIDDKDYKS